MLLSIWMFLLYFQVYLHFIEHTVTLFGLILLRLVFKFYYNSYRVSLVIFLPQFLTTQFAHFSHYAQFYCEKISIGIKKFGEQYYQQSHTHCLDMLINLNIVLFVSSIYNSPYLICSIYLENMCFGLIFLNGNSESLQNTVIQKKLPHLFTDSLKNW